MLSKTLLQPVVMLKDSHYSYFFSCTDTMPRGSRTRGRQAEMSVDIPEIQSVVHTEHNVDEDKQAVQVSSMPLKNGVFS